jgi:hypothetical protein
VAVKLTIHVKVRHIWWWGKIRSDGDGMTNFAHSGQELTQQKTRNQFRDLTKGIDKYNKFLITYL